MAGDGDRRKFQAMLEHSVDQDEAFDRTVHQHARIFFNQVGLAAMACGQIEVAFFDERLLRRRPAPARYSCRSAPGRAHRRGRIGACAASAHKSWAGIQIWLPPRLPGPASPAGIERTPGALFSTSEMVAGDRFRYSPRVRRLMGCPGFGSRLDFVVRLAIHICCSTLPAIYGAISMFSPTSCFVSSGA